MSRFEKDLLESIRQARRGEGRVTVIHPGHFLIPHRLRNPRRIQLRVEQLRKLVHKLS